jgi:hypothetical protein
VYVTGGGGRWYADHPGGVLMYYATQIIFSSSIMEQHCMINPNAVYVVDTLTTSKIWLKQLCDQLHLYIESTLNDLFFRSICTISRQFLHSQAISECCTDRKHTKQMKQYWMVTTNRLWSFRVIKHINIRLLFLHGCRMELTSYF